MAHALMFGGQPTWNQSGKLAAVTGVVLALMVIAMFNISAIKRKLQKIGDRGYVLETRILLPGEGGVYSENGLSLFQVIQLSYFSTKPILSVLFPNRECRGIRLKASRVSILSTFMLRYGYT